MKFEQINSVQDWIQIDKILDNNFIKLKDSSYIKILEVKPINYSLKSNLEKSNILNSYKRVFTNLNFNLQILVQSKQEDLSNHISKIENLNIYPEITQKYVSYLNKLKQNSKSSAKNFYIILKSNPITDETNLNNMFEELENQSNKLIDLLSRCGNVVSKTTKEENQKIIKSFLNVNL